MIFGIVDRISGELARVDQQFTIILLQAFVDRICLDLTILEQLLKKYHAPNVGGNNEIGKL